MTPLALSGRVDSADGWTMERTLVRLGSSSEPPRSPYDIALVRNEHDAGTALSLGYDGAAHFTGEPVSLSGFRRSLRLGQHLSYLADGDILGVAPSSRQFRTLFRRSSDHNSFLVTERCNHLCLMCSQPPRAVNDGWLMDEIAEALPLVSDTSRSIGFTGGEPLTDAARFIDLMRLSRDLLPNTAIHVLTNGRAFAERSIVQAWAGLKHQRLWAGIPLYGAVDHLHDHVVQARGAFDESVLGILRMKDAGQRVEIRVVLHRITAARLLQTCEWLARNMPFVDHIALMGMEHTGFALANEEELWIDPVDYADDLAAGVKVLEASGVPVSIYNLPLCVLTPASRQFAVRSISDWKNDYQPECASCGERERCSGFFSSGRLRRSRGIQPLSRVDAEAGFLN
jgi:His-Xaa-Ser system radical SAM maturase HxsC